MSVRGRSPRRGGRAFTLLEVLVALGILGLSLTSILSAQAGLMSSAERAHSITLAAQLARCRMSELEVELLKNGYPLIDEDDSGPCCDDESDGVYTCSWLIERVELPEASELDSSETGSELDLATSDGDAPGSPGEGPDGGPAPDGDEVGGPIGPGSSGALGGLSALSSFVDSGSAELGPGLNLDTESLGSGSGLGGMADMLGSLGGGEGMSGLIQMVMGFVYPSLKPMLEASIRRVTVRVAWREGSREHSIIVSQFVTNPMMGGLDDSAEDIMNQLAAEAEGSSGSGAQTGSDDRGSTSDKSAKTAKEAP